MRKVLRRVKEVFNEFEDKSKGGLNFEGLHKAMLKLHDNISRFVCAYVTFLREISLISDFYIYSLQR